MSGPPTKWKTRSHFGVSLAVEASSDVRAAGGVRLTDDVDRSHRLLADVHVDVMHDEVPARKHFVGVDAVDGDPWVTDHVARRLPSPRDGVESLVGRAALGSWFPSAAEVVVDLPPLPVGAEEPAETE